MLPELFGVPGMQVAQVNSNRRLDPRVQRLVLEQAARADRRPDGLYRLFAGVFWDGEDAVAGHRRIEVIRGPAERRAPMR